MTTAIEPLKEQSTDLVQQAASVTIANPQELEVAVGLGKQIRDTRKAVEDYWNNEETGPVKLAHRAWKATVAKRDEMLAPLDMADMHVSEAITGWNAEQERKAREEQERLEAEERKKREAEIKAAAEAAKAEGAKAPELKQLRQQMRAEPLNTPVVAAPPAPKGLSTPKPWKAALTGSTAQEQAVSLKWVIHAITKNQLPLNVVRIDQAALNAWAKSTKGTVTVKGLRVFQDTGQVRYR